MTLAIFFYLATHPQDEKPQPQLPPNQTGTTPNMNIAPPRLGGSSLKPPPKWLPLASKTRGRSAGKRVQPGERIPSVGERIRPVERRSQIAGERTPRPGERTQSAGDRIHRFGDRTQVLEPRTQPCQNLTPPTHKATTPTAQRLQHPPIPHRRPLPSVPLAPPTHPTHARPRHGYVPNCRCYHLLGYYHVGGECFTSTSTSTTPSSAIREQKKGAGEGDETMRGRSRYRAERSDMEGRREGSVWDVKTRGVGTCCEKVVSRR